MAAANYTHTKQALSESLCFELSTSKALRAWVRYECNGLIRAQAGFQISSDPPLPLVTLINGDPELRPRSSKPKQGPSVYNFCLGGILCISGPVVTWLRVADPVSSFSEESRGAQGP